MEKVELKPCPFCGGEAEIERLGDRRRSTIYACTNCGCRLETGEEWEHGRDWNTRANDEEMARLKSALQGLLDLSSESGEIDRRLAFKDARKALGASNG